MLGLSASHMKTWESKLPDTKPSNKVLERPLNLLLVGSCLYTQHRRLSEVDDLNLKWSIAVKQSFLISMEIFFSISKVLKILSLHFLNHVNFSVLYEMLSFCGF